MSSTEVLPTMTIKGVTYNVVHTLELGESSNVRRIYGFTHHIGLQRPKGRRLFMVSAELIGNVVVRHTDPTSVGY